MEIYLDLVVLLNFLVDFLLLLGVNRMTGNPGGGKRAAFAALLGGIYGGACLLPGFSFLGSLLWRLVSLGLISVIAFGWEMATIPRACLFVVCSMALGGFAMAISRPGFSALVMGAAALAIVCRVGFSGGGAGRFCLPVELALRGKKLRLRALYDSGNTLRDPLTGEPVLILGADAAEELTGLTRAQLADPIGTMMENPLRGLRLIPYRTVDQPQGMLLGLRCDGVRIGGKPGGSWVAFAPQEFPDRAYQALTGGYYGAMDPVSGWAAAAAERVLHRRQRCAAPTAEGGGGAASPERAGAGG